MRDDYYVVACESVRCVANPKTHPCNVKGEARKARRQAVADWNDSIQSNAERRRDEGVAYRDWFSTTEVKSNKYAISNRSRRHRLPEVQIRDDR